ncbi:hypothetical protein BC835DRAFT_1423930 [Cytidiella melzeri]|nr:hypothetical protein BC835DRAFT_1423930 [Cytidiella melzeri]
MLATVTVSALPHRDTAASSGNNWGRGGLSTRENTDVTPTVDYNRLQHAYDAADLLRLHRRIFAYDSDSDEEAPPQKPIQPLPQSGTLADSGNPPVKFFDYGAPEPKPEDGSSWLAYISNSFKAEGPEKGK